MTRTINSTLALLSISFLAFCQFSDRVLAEMVWVGGHGDIGLEFNSTNNTLGLHIHLESATLANGGNFVGGKPSTGEVEPGDLIIGVPSARRTTRPAGNEWNFTGTTAGSHFWTLPATDMGNHPFVGFASEADEIGGGWTAPFSWRVTNVVAPGSFSMYTFDTVPAVRVSADRTTNLTTSLLKRPDLKVPPSTLQLIRFVSPLAIPLFRRFRSLLPCCLRSWQSALAELFLADSRFGASE